MDRELSFTVILTPISRGKGVEILRSAQNDKGCRFARSDSRAWLTKVVDGDILLAGDSFS
ncbi:MAG: hypothetical protein AMJ37_03485 [Dehalococcoidia bacterium DG_18]|nr:MAG: hypothetical protein AMJ37_03485 [Dehalococcoidia bacterium DG_18]